MESIGVIVIVGGVIMIMVVIVVLVAVPAALVHAVRCNLVQQRRDQQHGKRGRRPHFREDAASRAVSEVLKTSRRELGAL